MYLHNLCFLNVVMSDSVSSRYGSLKNDQNIKEVWHTVHWYCRDRVSSCNIYAVQQNTQGVSMSEFHSALMLAQHRSIIRSVFYKLYSQILYVVIRVLLDTSSRYRLAVSSSTHSSTTYQICEYSLYKTLLMMDRLGPKHVELTYVMNKLIETLCVSCWIAYIWHCTLFGISPT